MEKLRRAEECCQDSSWGAGGVQWNLQQGKHPWAGRSPCASPCAISRAGAALAGLWLTVNRSPWPCLNKWAIAGVTDRASCGVFGKASSESQVYGKCEAVSLSAPLHPFPHPGFESASLCKRRDMFPKQFVLFSKQNQKWTETKPRFCNS